MKISANFFLCGAVALGVSATACGASVAPVTNAKALKYSPMIFGHFIEHFDTQVYGGLFWPGHRLSDEDGFRKDVIEALREIKCPIVRWPGGCYVSDYHWKAGVGPNRQPMWNKAWAVEDPNTSGAARWAVNRTSARTPAPATKRK